MIKNKSKKKTKKVIKSTKKTNIKPISKNKKSAKIKRFKLGGGPLTEAQITMFVEHYNKHQCFPGSKIPCTITGKLTTCVGPWMKKKIQEYGGPENLLRKYRCRGALKKAKQIIKGVKPRKKKQKRKDEEGNYIIPTMPNYSPRDLSIKEKIEMSKSICMRPDIFLDNGRHCEGCMHFDICQNALKCKADPKKNYYSKPTIKMFTSRAK
jgi:hypothetical protein